MAPRFEDHGQLQLLDRDDAEEEEDCFEAIDKCEIPSNLVYVADLAIFEVVFIVVFIVISQGINAGDIKKLQDAGIYTCNGLMMHTKKNLTGIKGLSETKVDKICEAAEKIVHVGYMTGSDLMIRRKSVIRITTGSQALDELLGGGIETLAITEAFGEFRSGKTQLAHTLCVSTQVVPVPQLQSKKAQSLINIKNLISTVLILLKLQLPISLHGGNGKVAYIDTEGTLYPFSPLSITFSYSPRRTAHLLNSLAAGRTGSCLLRSGLGWTQTRFWTTRGREETGKFWKRRGEAAARNGAVCSISQGTVGGDIVDSVIALFRVDFSGRGELAERQQKLAQMLSRLTKISEEFNVAVYMTNQVIADPGGGMFISDPKKPAGGHVLAHAATIRLMLRKGKGEQRVCKIFDAPNLPEGEAISFNE
ncbi:hypothetical protein KSP39_PZI005165 [Platanthera zijinensis]|uniref:Uncharacterized protein n=1 Tax=Platanthera zijinensis TaxID=2320716 RepID=A0AAP0GB48_9ASPA